MRQRLLVGGGFLLVLILGGTAGFRIIEGWSFLDSLYMTVITITTVGFREIAPPSPLGQVFTMVLALSGVGALFYVATSIIQMAVEGEIRQVLGTRRMRSKIDQLKDHYLLCGYGRVGAEVALVFRERGVPFVIIESSAERLRTASSQGYLTVEGDATIDEVLEVAGIRRARGLVAASDSDAGNTFITLSARALNPNIYIISRAGLAASEQRMEKAGADRVVSPYILAGRRMAFQALQPNMVEFFDANPEPGRPTETVLAELSITSESKMVGMTLRDVFASAIGVQVLAIHSVELGLVVGPVPDYPIGAGDRVIVIGPETELERLGSGAVVRHQPSK